MVEGVPWMLQVRVAAVSTSLALSVPLMVEMPGTTVPLSRLPASMTVPARAAAALVITGTSLVPLMVMVRVEELDAPLLSCMVYAKTSVTMEFWAKALVSGSALLSV